MYDVITIGSATRDVFVQSRALETHAAAHSPTGVDACLPLGSKVTIDALHLATGGGATNAAVAFARLGKLRTACVARIGADENGRAVLDDLSSNGVATTFLQRDRSGGTGYSLILVSGSGERTILVYRGVSQRIAGRAISWSRLRTTWFYVTSLAGDLALFRRILAHAERTGAAVAWNPGGAELTKGWVALAPLARRCHVFNVNREEAAQLTGKPPEDLEGMFAVLRPTPPHSPSQHVVLLTDGPNGAYALTVDATWHIASRNLKTVNTTGAGDAFGSAFVLGLVHAIQRAGFIPARTGGRKALPYVSTIDYALRLAMANAEGVITHMGAKAGILSRMPSRAALAKYRVRRA